LASSGNSTILAVEENEQLHRVLEGSRSSAADAKERSAGLTDLFIEKPSGTKTSRRRSRPLLEA